MKTSIHRTARSSARQRGAAAVEFAIVVAAFVTLLIGICEFGRVLFYWNTASEAIRYGARTAVVCDINASVVQTRIASLMPLLKSSNVSVSYLPSGCDVTSCTSVTVSVTGVTVKTMIPFLPLTLTLPPFTTTLPRESLTTSTGGAVCQ
jgi:Flp pilus assembly protein TadG